VEELCARPERATVGGAGELVFDQLARTKDLGPAPLVRQLCDIGYFLRVFKLHMRFGDLSRAPLKLLRLQVTEQAAECDWLARPPDPWDEGLPRSVGARNASMQALEDAMGMRQLMLCLLPQIDTAGFRVFRPAAEQQIELIIAGTVAREDEVPQTVRSVAMRAKLLGFQFVLDGGVLASLHSHCAATI